jgi:Zn-dependent protease
VFGGRSTIQLARILGIRIGVDISWFFVLLLFIIVLSSSFRDVLDTSETTAYGTAVIAAMLFFVSLIAHELGHAIAARRLGIEIYGIDLWFFGGIAKLSRDTDTPGAEFKIAIAGPLVTVAVVGVCVLVGIALEGPSEFWDLLLLRSSASVSPAVLLVSWLATINAALFLFNMVPAFPLDGGRIARAAAWKVTGNRRKATRFSAVLGQIFAYVLIGWGIAQLFVWGGIGGLWWLVLGFFLWQAARGAVAQEAMSERLEGVRVQDIMDREPVTIPGDLPVVRAEDEYFLRYRWPWFPVVDTSGRFLGLVDEDRIRGAAAAGDGTLRVQDVMDPDQGDTKIGEDATLEVLLGSEPLRRTGALMAVDPDGVLRGVVTIDQVRRALQSAVAPPAVEPPR